MDRRIHQINRLLKDILEGRFDRVLPIVGPNDELNASMIGFNILKEELKSRTVSRDYFTSIVNSVSDMVFVLSPEGIITDVNRQAEEQLKRGRAFLLQLHFDNLLASGKPALLKKLLKALHGQGVAVRSQTVFDSGQGFTFPVEISINWLFDIKRKRTGLVATAKDITAQLQAESQVLRAVIDTQENERNRLSRDIHDSLGQEMSAVKMDVSAAIEMCKDLLIGPEGSTAEKQELLTIIGDMLNRSNTRLFQALADMRGICHNLMPRTLQDYGLIRAVKDLCKQTEQSAGVHFEINIQRRFPDLKKTVEIDIYRIVQEFINNATRHGQAMRMICHFGKTHQGSVVIRLRDDGRGFLIGTEKVGMGLENISSRVRSHGGTFSVMSQPGRGAEYRVDLPAGVIENRKV